MNSLTGKQWQNFQVLQEHIDQDSFEITGQNSSIILMYVCNNYFNLSDVLGSLNKLLII